jgi:hypothetical protein
MLGLRELGKNFEFYSKIHQSFWSFLSLRSEKSLTNSFKGSLGYCVKSIRKQDWKQGNQLVNYAAILASNDDNLG